MARIQQILYFTREALINMNRNKLLNSMAIGMIAVSLAIFGIFWLIYSNLNAVTRRWTESVHIIAYLDNDISDEQRLQLDAKVRAIEHVDEIVYIAPEEALETFKHQLGEHASLVDGIESNPLPASYEIQLVKNHRDVSGVRSVAKSLKTLPHIEEVQYGEQWLQNLTIVVTMLKFVGLFLGVFLFLTVIFIVSNTIKLTLYSREEEVTIMKFIGATETFIKGPFLAEGIIRGFLGSVLSLVLLFLIHKLFLTVVSFSSQTLLVFSAISFLSWVAIVMITLLGSFLGWCGSLLTLHKFLKTY